MFPLVLLAGIAAILALTMGGKGKASGGGGTQPVPGGGGVGPSWPSGPIGPGTVTPTSGPSGPPGVTMLAPGSTAPLGSGTAYELFLIASDYQDPGPSGYASGTTTYEGWLTGVLIANFFPNGYTDFSGLDSNGNSQVGLLNIDANGQNFPGFIVVDFLSNVTGTAGGPRMSAFALIDETGSDVSGSQVTSTDSGGTTNSGAATDVWSQVTSTDDSGDPTATNAVSFGADLIGSPGGAAPAATFPPVDGSGVPNFLRNPLQFATSGGYVPPNRRRRVPSPVATRLGASGPSGDASYGGHGGTPWPRDDDLV